MKKKRKRAKGEPQISVSFLDHHKFPLQLSADDDDDDDADDAPNALSSHSEEGLSSFFCAFPIGIREEEKTDDDSESWSVP